MSAETDFLLHNKLRKWRVSAEVSHALFSACDHQPSVQALLDRHGFTRDQQRVIMLYTRAEGIEPIHANWRRQLAARIGPRPFDRCEIDLVERRSRLTGRRRIAYRLSSHGRVRIENGAIVIDEGRDENAIG